jgi:CBS domain-containing protein
VTPDHGIWHAAQMMLEHRVSGLPVIDDEGRLAGMITEGDLLRRAELGSSAPAKAKSTSEDYIRTHSWRVGDVMTGTVVTIDENMPVDRIAAIMSANDIKRVPVMRGDRMIGIVSRADILRGLATVPRASAAGGDDAIRRAVGARLYGELDFDPARLGVTVGEGNVHLWGRVASEADRKAAQIATETVEGVRGITNSLRVDGNSEKDPAENM